MYDKKQLAIYIASAVVLVLCGFVAGMLFPVGPQAAKLKTADTLSSKVVTETNAYGKVANITGKNITLANMGDELIVPVSESATIFLFVVKTPNTTPVQEKVNFEEIKVGDSVNVKMELSASNKLEASYVSILPRAEE